MNHVVVFTVGYGIVGDEIYYIVKNSWSEDWGIDGHVKMARNRENGCGITTDDNFTTA